jgi:hypothetical protein
MFCSGRKRSSSTTSSRLLSRASFYSPALRSRSHCKVRWDRTFWSFEPDFHLTGFAFIVYIRLFGEMQEDFLNFCANGVGKWVKNTWNESESSSKR